MVLFRKFFSVIFCSTLISGLVIGPAQADSAEPSSNVSSAEAARYLFPSDLLDANKKLATAPKQNTSKKQVDCYIFSNFTDIQAYDKEYGSENIKYSYGGIEADRIIDCKDCGARSNKALHIKTNANGFVKYVLNLMPNTNYNIALLNLRKSDSGIISGNPELYINGSKVAEGNQIADRNGFSVRTPESNDLTPVTVELKSAKPFELKSIGDWHAFAAEPVITAPAVRTYNFNLSKVKNSLLSKLISEDDLIFKDTANESIFKGELKGDQRISAGGKYTLKVKGTKWGISAESSINIVVNDDKPDPGHPGTVFTVTGGDRVADGAGSHEVSVSVKDATGNPVTGVAGALVAVADPADGVTVGPWRDNRGGITTMGRIPLR